MKVNITIDGQPHKWHAMRPMRHEDVCRLAGVDASTHNSFCTPQGTRGEVRLFPAARYTAREGHAFRTLQITPTT